jgi:endoglucanase
MKPIAFTRPRTRARCLVATILLAAAALGACDTPAAVRPDPPVAETSNPLSGTNLFVNPQSPARQQADAWRITRPADAGMMDRIAVQSVAVWMNGSSANVRDDVATVIARAAAAGATPVLVAYNIPGRNCASSGAANASAYREWIQDFANGLSGRAVVVLEPDALAGAGCLSASAQAERSQLLRDAVQVLKAAQAIVYIDGGHAHWQPVDVMSDRLNAAGIAMVDGFALNVANYVGTPASVAYGNALSDRLGGKHYVIDTSRNGLGGVAGEWCNVPGQALGPPPTTSSGHARVDAFLWVKYPGESDGPCNGGPSSGGWWAEYALGLAQRQ